MSKLKVVFDYDGPLHDLLLAIELFTGVAKERFKVYNFKDTDELYAWEIESVISACHSSELFEVCGMRDMKPVTELFLTGLADIYIHSLCWTQDIADTKRNLIHKYLPWLPNDKIILDVDKEKTVLYDVDILVEDCAANINKSRARVMNILIPQYEVKQEINNPLTVQVSSLDEACNWVKDYLCKDVNK